MAFNDWAKMPFDQAVQVNPSIPLRRGYVYPFVDMQAVDPNSRSVTLSEMREFKGGGSRFISGDTLMARITPCLENGKIARYIATDSETLAHGSTEFIVIRGREKVTDNGFAYYLTKWEGVHQFCISQMTGSSGRQRVPTIALSHCEVSVPPLKEQQAIACILGALDDKIELNRRMNKTLEEMARAIFKSWFVDFDPVRAKAAGQTPQGLTPEIAALFPDSFEDSELGQIPKGWKVKSIEDVAERVSMGPFGSSIKVETFVSEGMPVISGQHLNGLMLEDKDYNFISHEHAERLKNSNVKRGDIVLTHAGNIGQVAFIPDNSRYEKYIISQRQYFLRCDSNFVTPRFMVLYLKTAEGQHRLLANTSSSGVPSIAQPVTYTKRIPLIATPKLLMDVFDRLLNPLFLSMRQNQGEANTLSALREALLPKLISGEIRVADAERIVGRHI